jgi:hypothetical protein
LNLFANFSRSLWHAAGGHQTRLANLRLGTGDAHAGSLKIRPGLLRAIAANGADIEPVGLGERLGGGRFDLRSEAWKNGQPRGKKSSYRDGRKRFDHDSPL